MKNIFSRFLAKSLLGLSLLAAPALSLACGPTFDALGTDKANNTSVTVYWDNTPAQGLGVNSYRIAYRVSGSYTWYYTAWSGNPAYVFNGPFIGHRSLSVVNLQSGTAYDFMLWGKNTGNGIECDSDIVYGTTKSTATTCYKASDVYGEMFGEAVNINYQIDGGTNAGTRVTWGPTANYSSWPLFNFVEFQENVTPYTNNFNSYNIPNGSYFRVGVKCSANGTYSYSNVFQVNGGWNKEAVTNTLAESASVLSVYPNPSNGAFRLTFNTELEAATEFNVLDINGKTVLTQTVDRNETEALVDMTGNSAGVYFLKFNGETKKIVLR